MTRLQRHHCGAELDATRLASHERDGGHGVEVLRELRDPRSGEARLLGGSGVADHLVDLGRVTAGLGPHHDADAHGAVPYSVSRPATKRAGSCTLPWSNPPLRRMKVVERDLMRQPSAVRTYWSSYQASRISCDVWSMNT